MVAQPSAFFTREAFEAVGGLDPRYHYAMDYDLWLKLASRYDVHSVDRTLAAFRIHDRAKSSAAADRFWPEVRRISRRHGGRFFTRGYVEYRFEHHPWLWRSRMAYRFLAAGEYREFVSRAAVKVRLRRPPDDPSP
jgi:GT2 family glycosyltransferase